VANRVSFCFPQCVGVSLDFDRLTAKEPSKYRKCMHVCQNKNKKSNVKSQGEHPQQCAKKLVNSKWGANTHTT